LSAEISQVYTKQYNVDPYTGERRKGGPKYNVHGGWIADNSREDMLKLLGVEDMDALKFEPPTGLGVSDNVSSHNAPISVQRAAQALQTSHPEVGSVEEILRNRKTPLEKAKNPVKGGNQTNFDWAETQELHEFGVELGELTEMSDIIANIEAVANSGADRAFMMSALLEHYHLLLKQGMAKNLAKEKVFYCKIMANYFINCSHVCNFECPE